MAVCCMSVIANAQIQKGSVLLGGNVSSGTYKQSNSNDDNTYKQNYFNLAPSLGFVTADNKVWGFDLSASLRSSKGNDQISQTEYSGYGGLVYHRRYLTLGKGFYLFGQATAGYSYTKSKYKEPNNTGSNTARIDNIFLSAHPGVTFAVSKKFHLEAGLSELLNLSYSARTETNVSSGTARSLKVKNLNFGSNFSNSNPLSIGFRFVL